MTDRARPGEPGQQPPFGGVLRQVGPTLARRPVLARHGARALDPIAAVRLAGAPPLPTAYVADQLLLPAGPAGDPALEALRRAATESGLRVVPDPRGVQLAAATRGRDHEPAHRAVRLEPAGDRAAAVDAWDVLQRTRALLGEGAPSRSRTAEPQLDHVLLGTDPDVSGLPNTEGHSTEGLPNTEGHSGGPGSYPSRLPVTWLSPPPPRATLGRGRRRPVVAVLDTGAGRHPWLDGVVRTDVNVDGVPAGATDPATDPEHRGDLSGPLDGLLDTHSGHGTFICGLIRQLCPDADVLAIRVMASDGVVRESDLLHALDCLVALADRQRRGHASGQAVDAVVLSLGYYHEEPADQLADAPLLEVIQRLGRLGVLVVAAAGNSASTRPLFPAAFAPNPAGPVVHEPPDCLPVVSVGAMNPDGSVALFSNAGPWVACWQPGAALVSTMPVTFDGGYQPSIRFRAADGSMRATLDPDDFSSGFAVWNGTSFAAPSFAGHYLQRLWQDAGGRGLPVRPAPSMVADRRAVLAQLLAERQGDT